MVAVTIFLSVLRDFLAVGFAIMGGTSWAASWFWNFLRDSSKLWLLRLGGVVVLLDFYQVLLRDFLGEILKDFSWFS